MLHMLTAIHGPETCAMVIPEIREKSLTAFKRRDEVAKKLGITFQGAWTNMPNHTMYFLVDAPNAHVVNQMAMELHLMDWNTVTVSPLLTLEESQRILEAQNKGAQKVLTLSR
jgi:hypothetical protein